VALVTLTVVANEMEAEMLCGELRANGTVCSQRNASIGGALYGEAVAGAMFGQASPTEVLVEEEQLGEARKLLPDAR
jgi:putative signal transducing protein